MIEVLCPSLLRHSRITRLGFTKTTVTVVITVCIGTHSTL